MRTPAQRKPGEKLIGRGVAITAGAQGSGTGTALEPRQASLPRERQLSRKTRPVLPGYAPTYRTLLTARDVKLNLGGSVHDPTDPVGRLLFNVPAMVAEFEADLMRMRTREGMKVARAEGRLRGRQPKLCARQEAHLVSLWRSSTRKNSPTRPAN
jgi:hypothetical protein